jgi:hypothetical protein
MAKGGQRWPNHVFVTASKGGSMSEELIKLWILKFGRKEEDFSVTRPVVRY